MLIYHNLTLSILSVARTAQFAELHEWCAYFAPVCIQCCMGFSMKWRNSDSAVFSLSSQLVFHEKVGSTRTTKTCLLEQYMRSTKG